MDSDDCDDIEVIEVVRINKDHTPKPVVKRNNSDVHNGNEKMYQPSVSEYFSVIDDTSSSDTVIYDDKIISPKPISVVEDINQSEIIANGELKSSLKYYSEFNAPKSFSGVLENKCKTYSKVENDESYNTLIGDSEHKKFDGDLQNNSKTYTKIEKQDAISTLVSDTEQKIAKGLNIIVQNENKPYAKIINEASTSAAVSKSEQKISDVQTQLHRKIKIKASTSATVDKLEKKTSDVQTHGIKILQKFIYKWKEVKGNKFGNDDRKVEEKLWKHYNNCSLKYTSSKKFLSAIEKSTAGISEKTEFVFIKEIVDRLKHYRESACHKIISINSCKVDTPAEVSSEEVIDSSDAKKKNKMLKLEKLMKKIDIKIRQLDEEEVDFSDENNSSYLLQERLKKQFIKVNTHYCKLAKLSTRTGRPTEKKLNFKGTRYPEINNKISSWVNKYKCFPDYVDILDLVKRVTEDKKLPLRPEAIRVQAEDIFTNVGKILKHRRLKDDLFSMYAYTNDDLPVDPAHFDSDLDSKLMSNATEARYKLEKIFQDYVDKEVEKGAAADSTDTESSDEHSSTHSKEEVGAYISDLENNDYSPETGNDDETSMKAGTSTNIPSTSKLTAYSSPNISMDSFPDITNKPQTKMCDIGHNASNETDCKVKEVVSVSNGIENDDSSHSSHKSHLKSPQLQKTPIIKDTYVAWNDDSDVETVDIDSSPGEKITNDKKRKRNDFTIFQKRRCLSPEVVEID